MKIVNLRDYLAYLWIYWNVSDDYFKGKESSVASSTLLAIIKYIDNLFFNHQDTHGNIQSSDVRYYPKQKCLCLSQEMLRRNGTIRNNSYGLEAYATPDIMFSSNRTFVKKIHTFGKKRYWEGWQNGTLNPSDVLKKRKLGDKSVELCLSEVFPITEEAYKFLGVLVIGVGKGFIWIGIRDSEDLLERSSKEIAIEIQKSAEEPKTSQIRRKDPRSRISEKGISEKVTESIKTKEATELLDDKVADEDKQRDSILEEGVVEERQKVETRSWQKYYCIVCHQVVYNYYRVCPNCDSGQLQEVDD